MTACLFHVKKSVGKVLFYSNYVNMEGIQIFKIYLSFIGIMEYKGDTRSSYIEFHGGVSMLQRKKNLIVFNSSNNIDGSQIKVILLSSAGAEGIDLFNIRTVLILEPNWDEETIYQIIGRAIRQCSHRDLPLSERNVQVYRFKVNKRNNEPATDKYIEILALEKQTLKDSFLETLKEAAVDCRLYAKHNMIERKYNCFQFSQDDVLKKNPGPAYKKKFEDDENEKIMVKKIKVRRIKAISNPDEKSQEYLLDETTGIVYDSFLEFPVGKVNKDDKGFFLKSNIDTYILSL
jgi:superfamily II DNA/RNA helicase